MGEMERAIERASFQQRQCHELEEDILFPRYTVEALQMQKAMGNALDYEASQIGRG